MSKLSNIKDFCSNHSSWLLPVIVGAVMFGAGYGTGHFTVPAKVVEKEKIVTKIQEKIVYQDKIVFQKVYIKAKKQHTETKTVKNPDGTTTTTTSTDIDTQVHSDTTKVETKIVYQDRIVEKLVEKEKIILNQPNWRVAAGAGVAIPYYLGQGSPGVPGLQGAVINVGADRRIVGPFWVGVHANTQGVLGLELSGVF